MTRFSQRIAKMEKDLERIKKDIQENEKSHGSIQGLSNMINMPFHSEHHVERLHAGERWTQKEDEHVAQQFRNLICEMSSIVGRSPGAIQSRISRALRKSADSGKCPCFGDFEDCKICPDTDYHYRPEWCVRKNGWKGV